MHASWRAFGCLRDNRRRQTSGARRSAHNWWRRRSRKPWPSASAKHKPTASRRSRAHVRPRQKRRSPPPPWRETDGRAGRATCTGPHLVLRLSAKPSQKSGAPAPGGTARPKPWPAKAVTARRCILVTPAPKALNDAAIACPSPLALGWRRHPASASAVRQRLQDRALRHLVASTLRRHIREHALEAPQVLYLSPDLGNVLFGDAFYFGAGQPSATA